MMTNTTTLAEEPTLADLLPISDSKNYWQHAACQGDPNHEAWFPYPSQDFEYARAICDTCPIRRDCGAFAARTGQSGVWGGHEYDRGNMIRE